METKQQVRIELNYQPSGGKTWVAEITGTDPKYGFKREFLREDTKDTSYSGKTGRVSYLLTEGKVYEICEAWKGRYYTTIKEGDIQRLTREELEHNLQVRQNE